MSILIKGMEMPTCCAGCCLDRFCKHWDIVPYRHEDCPLVPVQPHGRLIDADAYKQELKDCRAAFWDEVLDSMPTIIPAEEGE